jgi:thiol peroxidase
MTRPYRVVPVCTVLTVAIVCLGCRRSANTAQPPAPRPAMEGSAAPSEPTTEAPSEGTTPEEWVGKVTRNGEPLTLLGNEVSVGDPAPDFQVVDNDMAVVDGSSLRGKVALLISVPSLDTNVCSLETRKFNEEAGKLGKDVEVVVISMDLPFAQKRWVEANHATNIRTLSDYRDASFGMAYGVLIKDLHLLARAVFVVDAEGMVRYVQIVPELTSEPDYNAALQAVRDAIGQQPGPEQTPESETDQPGSSSR